MRRQITGIFAAGFSGTLVALILGVITMPLVAVSAGAVTAFVVTRKYDVQRHYDSVGTVYFLSLGLLVFALPFLPAAFKQTPQLFLVVFGLISAAIVLTKRGVSHVLRFIATKLGRGDSASSVWNAVSSIVGTLMLIWSIIKMKQRLAKTALVGATTPLGLVLNLAGHFVNLPWALEAGIDLSAMVFLGGVMVGFHTLTSWYEVLALRNDPFVQSLAERSKDTAVNAASKTREKAANQSDRVTQPDGFGSGLMSQILGVTPAATGATSSTVSDSDPEEDFKTADAQPTDSNDGASDASERDVPAAQPDVADGSDGVASRGRADSGTARNGNATDSSGSAELEQSAERLGLPPEPEPITDGIETMISAIDAVAEENDTSQVETDPERAAPIERATVVKTAADGGTLVEDSDGDGTETIDSPAETTHVVTAAARSARTRAPPQATEGQELLDALERVDDLSERRLATTLETVLTQLNSHDDVVGVLSEVESSPGPREIARQLERGSSTLDGPFRTGLTRVANELDDAVSELEECRAELDQLSNDAEALCTAANDQTTVNFESDASTVQWFDALADRFKNGTLVFTDQASDIRRIVSNAETDIHPQSRLAQSVLEAIRSDSLDAEARERTIADAITAIDSTETLRHRLEGISAEDVEQLAQRLQRDLSETSSPGTAQLADRVDELRRTAAQAATSDRMTVYAARQELRFYDQQLLDALQDTTSRSQQDTAVAQRYEDVEQRRTRMRDEYPRDYPDHDHSISIHFLELVTALQQSADQARTAGNDERASGYLEAADRVLDWVTELYDRHAYNVLLEQLRR